MSAASWPALAAKDRRHGIDGVTHRLIRKVDVLEGRARIAVAEQAADGENGLAGLNGQTRVVMAKIMQANVTQLRLVSQCLPKPVETLCRSGAGSPRKDLGAPSGQAVKNLAGGQGQPDGPRSGLDVPQEEMAVADVPPLQGHDLALAAAGQDQQPDCCGHLVAFMPCKRPAQSTGLRLGQEPFPAAPPVPPDVPARIAVFRAEAERFRFLHDHRQDWHRPVGGDRGRPERGEPFLHVQTRDGADRKSLEPWKDMVLEVTAIYGKRAGFPEARLPTKDGVRDILERGFR